MSATSLSMSTSWFVVSAVLTIFAVVAAGAAMRLRGWLTADADRSLLELTVRLLMPCFILKATMASEALRHAENLVWPPLLGFATLGLSFVGSSLLARGFARDAERRTFRFVAGTFNYGYIPIPLVTLLFPHDGTLGVLIVYVMGVELGFWTLGVLVLSGGLGGQWWKRLANPPSIAVVLGVSANLSGATALVPRFLAEAVGFMGTAAVPLALLLVGAMTADHVTGLRLGAGGGVARAVLLRAVLAPAGFLALAVLLPVSLEMKRVLVVESAMPAAMFSIVVSRYYGGDSALAVRTVIATSVVALLAIPLWISAGMAWL